MSLIDDAPPLDKYGERISSPWGWIQTSGYDDVPLQVNASGDAKISTE
jgi:hypothetical protein